MPVMASRRAQVLALCALLIACGSRHAMAARMLDSDAVQQGAPEAELFEWASAPAPAPGAAVPEPAAAPAPDAPSPRPQPDAEINKALGQGEGDVNLLAAVDAPTPPPSPPPPSPPPPDAEADGTTTVDEGDGSLTIQEGSLATQGPVPPIPNFTPVQVPPAFKGTCDLQDGNRQRCDDGMNLNDGTTPDDYRLMGDPDQAEACGLVPLTSVVQSFADWAYKGRWGGCGVRAFTAARVCIGEGRADGRWRARVLLWPDSDACEPLCVKMTGEGSEAVEFGRTASC